MTTEHTNKEPDHIEQKGDVLDDLDMRLTAGTFMDTYCETHPLYETARSLFLAACRNDQAGMQAAFQVVEQAEAIDPDGWVMEMLPGDPYEANPHPHARPLQTPPEKAILRTTRVREVLFEIDPKGKVPDYRADLVALFFALISRDDAATTAAYARIGERVVSQAWIDSDDEWEKRFGTSH